MHFVVMRVVEGAVCRQEDVFFVSMTSLGTLQRAERALCGYESG